MVVFYSFSLTYKFLIYVLEYGNNEDLRNNYV